MNQWRQFETPCTQSRVRREASKSQSATERKRSAAEQALRQRLQRIEAMIGGLRNDLRLLDQNLEAQLESSPTRNLDHFAFPMALRALIARRENLKSTISMLLPELAKNVPDARAATDED